jgi:hypothetical protein
MPVFTIQAPDGRKIKIEAADEATAMRGAQEYARANPKVSTGRDVATGFLSGAVESVRGMAQQAVKTALPALPGAWVDKAANVLAQTDYTPQTEAGKVARTAGQMAPAAIAPGSVGQRAANVLVPTVTTEVAGRTAKALGANETGVEVARAVGGIAGGVAANARLPAKPKAPKAKTPTLDALRSAKDTAYREVDAAGVQYKPEASTRLADTIKTKLEAGMVDPDLHPKVTAVAKRVEALRNAPITLTKLDQVRRVIRDNVFTPSASRDERRLGYQMIDALDEFVATAGADDVLSAGDPNAAAQALQKARDLNSRVAKIESIEGAKVRAANRAASSGSGGNVNNATRREVMKVAERGRNWTPAEQEALDRVVKGSRTQNVLRQVGKLSPEGNGLMLGGHLFTGLKTGGLSALVIPPAMVAKHVADGMTMTAVDDVIRLIASGKEAQAAQLAARDPKVAALLRDIQQANLGGSTVNALRAGGTGSNWQAPWQQSARPPGAP